MRLLFLMILISCQTTMLAQNNVNWLTFEELEIVQAEKSKKILIYFTADWCVYCKKMDRRVFTKSEVIQILNTEYYAVKFNAESEISVQYRGKIYINDQIGENRNPLHQITQWLATREGEFVAPTLVILDENYTIQSKTYEYMTSDEMLEVLKL